MAGYIEIPNKFRHPFRYIEAVRIRELQEKSISAEDFFFMLTGYIRESCNSNGRPPYYDSLLFYGFDSRFMNRPETIDGIAHTVSQRNKAEYPAGKPLQMIASEQDDISKYERWFKDPKFCIFKVPEEIKKGYIIYGPYTASVWDSTTASFYPPEQETEIFRGVLSLVYLAPTYQAFMHQKVNAIEYCRTKSK
jgi:hypothetical protein